MNHPDPQKRLQWWHDYNTFVRENLRQHPPREAFWIAVLRFLAIIGAVLALTFILGLLMYWLFPLLS